MELEDLATISIEGCASVLLLVFAYKVYRAKIDSETSSECCKYFHFKLNTHNPGGTLPSAMTQV